MGVFKKANWEWISDATIFRETSQAFSDPEDLEHTKVTEHYGKNFYTSTFHADLSAEDALETIKSINGYTTRQLRSGILNQQGGHIKSNGTIESVSPWVSSEAIGWGSDAGDPKPRTIHFKFREDGTVDCEMEWGAFDEHWRFLYRDIDNNPSDLNTADLRSMVRHAKERGVSPA